MAIYSAVKRFLEKALPHQFRQFTTDIKHISGCFNIVANSIFRIDEISKIDYTEILRAQREDSELQSLLHESLLELQ